MRPTANFVGAAGWRWPELDPQPGEQRRERDDEQRVAAPGTSCSGNGSRAARCACCDRRTDSSVDPACSNTDQKIDAQTKKTKITHSRPRSSRVQLRSRNSVAKNTTVIAMSEYPARFRTVVGRIVMMPAAARSPTTTSTADGRAAPEQRLPLELRGQRRRGRAAGRQARRSEARDRRGRTERGRASCRRRRRQTPSATPSSDPCPSPRSWRGSADPARGSR